MNGSPCPRCGLAHPVNVTLVQGNCYVVMLATGPSTQRTIVRYIGVDADEHLVFAGYESCEIVVADEMHVIREVAAG